MSLVVRGAARAFDGKPALRGARLDIADGEIMCLLGPSGCGKTTLLRVIAGLEALDAGDVLLDGKSIVGVPVHARGFGLMFQDFALFPHMTVGDNVRFGLKMRGMPRAQQDARAREMLALVGMPGYDTRDVAALSGGERQRVALARSLAPSPRLLMLDEPMGSLDAALREHLVVELRSIIRKVGLTAIYVTHDQQEAYSIADRVAVMNAGRIEQVDAPDVLYRAPRTAFVARFLGLDNLVPVLSQAGAVAHTSLGAFKVVGEPKSLLLHPDGLALATPGTPDAVPVRVQSVTFQGRAYRVVVAHDSGATLRFAVRGEPPPMGTNVALSVDPRWVVALNEPGAG